MLHRLRAGFRSSTSDAVGAASAARLGVRSSADNSRCSASRMLTAPSDAPPICQHLRCAENPTSSRKETVRVLARGEQRPQIQPVGADRFHRHLAVCAAWQHAHGRLPDESSPDNTERALGEWLASARRAAAAGSLPETHRSHLFAFLRGWAAADLSFEHSLTSCCAWVVANGRLPRGGSTDPEESHHATWIANRRTDRLLGRLSASREQTLDAALPGWNAFTPVSRRRRKRG